MEFLKKVLSTVKVAIAKLYNALPSKVKIGLMVASSFLISGWLTLVVRDISAYNTPGINEYLKTAIDALLPLLTIVINLVQQAGVDAGTKILAERGDETTIDTLRTSVDKKLDLIDSAK